ncbi:MAG: hypothetical protein WHS46_11400 [Desulfosoma sp.]
MNENDKRAVLSWNTHVSGKVPLGLQKTRDTRSAVLQAFGDELVGLTPHISLETTFRDTNDLPAFFVGNGWIWHAAPSGAEFRPFLETLALFHERSAESFPSSEKEQKGSFQQRKPDLWDRLQGLQKPTELLVFTASQCPHCAHMLFELGPLPFLSSYLVIRVLDALLFAEKAQEAGIRSVPTILYGDHFRWTGRVDLAHVLEVVCRDEHTELSAAAAVRLLKEGKAKELSRLMLTSSKIWKDFASVLTHAEWSVRLGALVVLEELAEKNVTRARAYLPLLWENMDTFSAAVQGDVIYATGMVGDSTWAETVLQWAQKHAQDAELQEVAEETINILRTKRSP